MCRATPLRRLRCSTAGPLWNGLGARFTETLDIRMGRRLVSLLVTAPESSTRNGHPASPGQPSADAELISIAVAEVFVGTQSGTRYALSALRLHDRLHVPLVLSAAVRAAIMIARPKSESLTRHSSRDRAANVPRPRCETQTLQRLIRKSSSSTTIAFACVIASSTINTAVSMSCCSSVKRSAGVVAEERSAASFRGSLVALDARTPPVSGRRTRSRSD